MLTFWGGGGVWKNLSLRGVTNNQYIGRRCLKGGGHLDSLQILGGYLTRRRGSCF